jgi:hypothetical protein
VDGGILAKQMARRSKLMKRTHLFGTMMACALATVVGVGAQERPSATATDSDSKNVVVTGCLKSDSAGAAGTAGTVGTTGSTATTSARGFIVTDAVVSNTSASTTGATATTPPSGSTAGTGATAGTSGTSTEAKDGKTFTVVGGTPSELQTYVNSKVEIRGTLDEKAAHSPSGATGTSGTPTTGTPTTGTPTTGTPTTGAATTGSGSTMAGMSHGDHPKLRVTSVRQIAGSCGGQ